LSRPEVKFKWVVRRWRDRAARLVRKPLWRVGTLRFFGGPVYVTRWVVFVCIAGLVACALEPSRAPLVIASWLAIIAVHEWGHAFVAARVGARVVSVKIGLLHGLCEHEQVHSRGHDILIAWGGVAAQVVVAIPLLVLAESMGSDLPQWLGPPVTYLGGYSLLIAACNLAPAPGFDGAKAWLFVPDLYYRVKSWRVARRAIRRAAAPRPIGEARSKVTDIRRPR
jgi:hypothetical protein